MAISYQTTETVKRISDRLTYKVTLKQPGVMAGVVAIPKLGVDRFVPSYQLSGSDNDERLVSLDTRFKRAYVCVRGATQTCKAFADGYWGFHGCQRLSAEASNVLSLLFASVMNEVQKLSLIHI